jgi:STE24 endopeptidase
VTGRAKAYARVRRRLGLAEFALSVGFLLALLGSGGAVAWANVVERRFHAWPLQVLLYAGGLWLLFAVLSFPLDFHRGWRLERRYGLSTQRGRDWLKDYFKQLAIAGALGLFLVEGLVFLLREDPSRWWIWAALGWVAWSVLLTRVAPQWLIPLFYRQKPLEDLRLKEALIRLLEQCSTPVQGLFEINLSRTTRKANACLCGMGASRRVLISDTLLSAYPAEEIEVVLAHEVGHHRLHHIGILILLSSLAVGISCIGVDRAIRAASVHFVLGPLGALSTLPLMALAFTAMNLLLLPALNGLSRRLEAQADRFALEKTGDPGAFTRAMRRLASQNLSEIQPPHWVEWVFYDHPSVGRRIAMAELYGK